MNKRETMRPSRSYDTVKDSLHDDFYPFKKRDHVSTNPTVGYTRDGQRGD